ncbi:MAG: hypothetical protein Q4A84_10350 [Neisseria sp.]|uniref:hypothetical protein n=1 Tax=Neisseria sp. TaxID=192066 RepID=UPI0026DD7CA4|nr:hypothetical protein [Neisseria sp.]MDO4642077.1 hypothetical protein [Neisseria sp.]
MNNTYPNSNQEAAQTESNIDAWDVSANDVQGANMTWDIMSSDGSADQSYFGDFFPMQAAG